MWLHWKVSSHRHWEQMQFTQKFYPLHDKQVIASALRQLRINFTCIFWVFPKIPKLPCNLGTFGKTLKIIVKLILNCPRACEITYTNYQQQFTIKIPFEIDKILTVSSWNHHYSRIKVSGLNCWLLDSKLLL